MTYLRLRLSLKKLDERIRISNRCDAFQQRSTLLR